MSRTGIKLDKKIIFSVSVLLLSIGGFSIDDSFGQTNGIPELLSDTKAQNSVASSSLQSIIPSDNLIRESKQVYANTSVFDQDAFTITTFDETITITKDSSEVKDDYTVWWGTTNDGYDANFLIFDDGTIQASIQTAETKYNIGSTGIDTIHTLEDIDVIQLPPDHGADYFASTAFDSTTDQIGTMDFPNLPQDLQNEIELFANSHVGGRDYRENAVTITLVVGYTTEVDDENTNIDRIIRGAVEDANRSYRVNGLPIVLDLVDIDEVRYVEEITTSGRNPVSGLSQDLDNLLDELGANNPNPLDRLRADGANQNADVIILVTHYPDVQRGTQDPNGCGQAGEIFTDNIDDSVAIVRDICLASNLSLPHEIGHLQGAQHNPEAPHARSDNPFQYQHGHYSTVADERTIMSYDCPGGCIRMGQWSDPNETYGNRGQVQAGSETDHFNAKVLYGSAQYVASLRGDVERYDNIPPQGAFEWIGEQVSQIFNQGDTMNIRATFDEPIHEDHPPTVTISDTNSHLTSYEMDRVSSTQFTKDHTLTNEEGTVTLQFSNAQDLFTNPVTLSATGNSGSVTVNPPDITPPVITLNPPNPQTIEVGNGYTELDATTDDGSPVTINDSAFVDAVGSYSIFYNSVDLDNNPAIQVVRTVNVVDTTKPLITLNGVTSILEVGVDTYTELGATVTDNDSSYSGTVTIGGDTVDTTIVESYTVTYNALPDASLNTPDQVIRVVEVVDTIPPTFDVNGNTVDFTTNLDFGVTYNLGAIQNIVEEQTTTQSIIDSSNIDGTAPPVGNYAVTYTVTEVAGNRQSTSIDETVIVEAPPDTTPPVITLVGNDLMIEVHSEFVEPGFTATDDTDGNITENVIVSGQVNTSTLGNYTLSYDVADTVGNNAITQTRAIMVEDTTDPDFGTIENILEEATHILTSLTLSIPSVTDNYDSTLITTVDNSGPFPLGNTTITWTATDSSNNEATADQIVTIQDTTPPVITAPDDIITEATDVLTPHDVGSPTATDIFDVTFDPLVPFFLPIGTTTITWNATDANNNTATAIQLITVQDTTAPTFDVSGNTADYTTNIELGNTYTQGIIQNILDIQLTTQSITGIVDVNTEGEYPVTFTVTDASTNTASITEIVTVQDTALPTFTFIPSDQFFDVTAFHTPLTQSDYGTALSTDVISNNAPDTFLVGDTIITWTVTDENDNSVTANQTITVQDAEKMYELDINLNNTTNDILINWNFGENPDRNICFSKTEIYIASDNGMTTYLYFGDDKTIIQQGGMTGFAAIVHQEHEKTVIPCEGDITVNVAEFGVSSNYSEYYVFMSFYETDTNDSVIPLNEASVIYTSLETKRGLECNDISFDTFPRTTDYVHDTEKTVTTILSRDVCDDPNRSPLVITEYFEIDDIEPLVYTLEYTEMNECTASLLDLPKHQDGDGSYRIDTYSNEIASLNDTSFTAGDTVDFTSTNDGVIAKFGGGEFFCVSIDGNYVLTDGSASSNYSPSGVLTHSYNFTIPADWKSGEYRVEHIEAGLEELRGSDRFDFWTHQLLTFNVE